MLWLSLTLLAALAMSLQDVFCKKIAGSTGIVLVTWMRWLPSLPFLAVCIPFMIVPKISGEFIIVTAALIPLDIFALVLYMKAIRISPLNVTLPFLSLTPIFMILTGYLFLGETLRPQQIVGIVFIAAGGYLINIHTIGGGIHKPITSIGKERGAVLMIVVAIIYSVTAVLGKKAVLLSNPLFFGISYTIVLSVAMMPMVFMLGPNPREAAGRLARNVPALVVLGIAGAVNAVAHYVAIGLVEAATMMAVKRTSLLFGILFGRLLFDEPHFRARIAGGVLMLIGVVCIYIV
jgi:drug/metabolite transporter (DMT)-like permease